MNEGRAQSTGTPRLAAVLFDMDGVITDTAGAHAAAWQRLFDAYLEERAGGGDFRRFAPEDYRHHLDGKPRYDGVESFLASRGISLPFGDPDDAPGRATICGLGNRKNRYFQEWLAAHRIEAYPGSLALIAKLKAAGVKVAVFSASRNAEAVLRSAGVLELFDAKVDGQDMAALGLPGKPDPAILNQALDRLGEPIQRAAVVEDAVAGVRAGTAGGFGAVVGVARDGHERELEAAGAASIVGDLAELDFAPDSGLFVKTRATLPSVWDHLGPIGARLAAKPAAIFLDYDGTLTPIVSDPRQATLAAGMKEAVRRLARCLPTAIISGRDLGDVQALVGLDSLFFAGSHGFAMAGPGGWRQDAELGKDFLPELDRAQSALAAALRDMGGAVVERKSFSLAVHFRNVRDHDAPLVEDIVGEVMSRFDRLRCSIGKKVFDIKPLTDWDKGRAVMALLGHLQPGEPDVVSLYLGDDTTDEDAFRALSQGGIGIVVRDLDDRRRTAARFALDGTEDVERFLDWLGREALRQRPR